MDARGKAINDAINVLKKYPKKYNATEVISELEHQLANCTHVKL